MAYWKIKSLFGKEEDFLLSDESEEILDAEVKKMNETLAKVEAETGKVMPKYKVEMVLINAIHKYVEELKMDQHSGNCGGPEK